VAKDMTNKELLEAFKEIMAAGEDTERAALAGKGALEKAGAAVKGIFGGTAEGAGGAQALLGNIKSIGGSIETELIGALGGAGSAAGIATTALLAFGKAIVSLAADLANAEAAFMKTTGANKDLARSMTVSYGETRKFGATIGETSAAMVGLHKTFTDFTFLNSDTQEELATTATLLTKLGVANEDVAKSIQISTKALGMMGPEAAQTQLDLTKFAEELGVPISQMGSDFANNADMLAKMGDRGVEAFKDLAIAAKVTGMEMSKILTLTNKFDTFEGAADMAGKLNAALGGNFVNAMDLMMATEPAERFEMIRSSILDAGLSFDTMGYYQKKFYADSLGLSDVNDLALILSGNFDAVDGAVQESSQSIEEAAARAQEMASLQERLNILLVAFIPIITPIIDLLSDMASWLAENAEMIVKVTAVLIIIGSIIALFTGFGSAAGVAGLTLGFGMLFGVMKDGQGEVSLLGRLFEGIMAPLVGTWEILKRLWEVAEPARKGLAALLGPEGLGIGGEHQMEDLAKALEALGYLIGVVLVLAFAALALAIAPFIVGLALAVGPAIALWAAYSKLKALFFEDEVASTFLEGLGKIADAFGQITTSISETLNPIGLMTDAWASVSDLFFEDEVASTFLEGLGKIANAFGQIAIDVIGALNPITQMTKLVDGLGSLFGGILSGVTSFFAALTAPEAAENIMKIGEAITAIPETKHLEFVASMGAAAGAATVGAAVTRFLPEGATPGERPGATPSERPYQVTINLQIDKKNIASVVKELQGGMARDAIAGRA